MEDVSLRWPRGFGDGLRGQRSVQIDSFSHHFRQPDVSQSRCVEVFANLPCQNKFIPRLGYVNPAREVLNARMSALEHKQRVGGLGVTICHLDRVLNEESPLRAPFSPWAKQELVHNALHGDGFALERRGVPGSLPFPNFPLDDADRNRLLLRQCEYWREKGQDRCCHRGLLSPLRSAPCPSLGSRLLRFGRIDEWPRPGASGGCVHHPVTCMTPGTIGCPCPRG